MVLFFVILVSRQAPGDGGETITGGACYIKTIKTVDICQVVGVSFILKGQKAHTKPEPHKEVNIMKRLDQLKLVQYMAYKVLEVQKGSKKEVCEKAYKIFTRKKDDWMLRQTKKADILEYLEEEIRLEEQEEIRRSEADYQAAWENWMSNK